LTQSTHSKVANHTASKLRKGRILHGEDNGHKPTQPTRTRGFGYQGTAFHVHHQRMSLQDSRPPRIQDASDAWRKRQRMSHRISQGQY
jgi:hypothetical protein